MNNNINNYPFHLQGMKGLQGDKGDRGYRVSELKTIKFKTLWFGLYLY